MTPIPRVTVVIPHHNGAHFLADTLGSVEHQRWRDWEIVIVDDGSVDEHRRAALAFASDRIRVLEQANQGPAAATQAGIDVARGEYIAFLDQDDLWLPQKLERDVRLLDRHPSVDLTFCGYQMIDECGRPLAPPHVPREERFDASDLLEDFCIGPTATVTVRAAAARHAGPINASLRRFYDFEYFIRIASRRPVSVAASRESLAWYRRHPGQLSADVSQMRVEWESAFGAMVSRYAIDDQTMRIAQSNMHRYFAFLEYEQGHLGAAWCRMVEAFCFAPGRFMTERRNWLAASTALTALILPSSVRQRIRVDTRGRNALLGALALCASPALHAQDGRVWPAERPISKSAERIARELWPTDVATSTIDEEGRPRFRSGITVTILPPPWRLTRDTEPTPSRGAISHQEMVRMMTPREYSTPPIGGSGGSVDPGSIFQSIRSAWRDRQERRIQQRVMRELEELERRNRAAEEEAK